MTTFRYKAISASSGEVVRGVMEAPSEAVMIDRLRSQGQMLVRATEPGSTADLGRWFDRLGLKRTLSSSDVALLTRELATLLQAGLPIDRALAVAGKLGPAGPRRRFIEAVLDAVRGGSTLANAIESQGAALPAFYAGMIRAGEAGGTLGVVLARLAETLERAQSLREAVQSAMYYPAIVMVVAGATLALLLTVVIPEFKPLLEDAGAAMPAPMAVLLASGDFLKGWWWLLVILVAATVIGIRGHNRSRAGRLRWDGWIRRLPLFGDLAIKSEVARFCRTLGTLLANGVSAIQATAIATGAVSNRSIAQVIDEATPRLRRGEGLAVPLLESGFFPEMAGQLLQVGEESGQLEAMLLRVADIYDEEVKRTVQRMTALLVPLVTIGLGILVASIIASMLTAILSTYDLSL